VIFAGGVGSRMASTAVPKQFLEIYGRPVIVHTLELFQNHDEIDGIIVAILPEFHEYFERIVKKYELDKVVKVVDGGATGQGSRHNALRAAAELYPEDSVVLIHDGVRPLIDADLISANIRGVHANGSAITCTKMTETVVEGSVEGGITDVVPREKLWTAQAPQSFVLKQVLGVYDQAVADGEEDSIDTCTLMRQYGHEISRVEGPRTNIKITTASDYYICRTFFTLNEDKAAFGGE
jgi:2-C-methyl-D-erythritol 4-phosphate cytidylyltransferase